MQMFKFPESSKIKNLVFLSGMAFYKYDLLNIFDEINDIV